MATMRAMCQQIPLGVEGVDSTYKPFRATVFKPEKRCLLSSPSKRSLPPAATPIVPLYPLELHEEWHQNGRGRDAANDVTVSIGQARETKEG